MENAQSPVVAQELDHPDRLVDVMRFAGTSAILGFAVYGLQEALHEPAHLGRDLIGGVLLKTMHVIWNRLPINR